MHRHVALATALLLGPTALAAQDFEGLVEGAGQEEVFYACSGCHSTRIIQQQGLTRERWDKLLAWMVEEQGMPLPSPEQRRLLLDYLATNYGPERPNWRR